MTVIFRAVSNFDQIPESLASKILYQELLPVCEREGVYLAPEGHVADGHRYEEAKRNQQTFDVSRVQRAFAVVDQIYQPASQYRDVSKRLFEIHPSGGYLSGAELMAAMMLKGYPARFAKAGEETLHLRAEFRVKEAKAKREREVVLGAQPIAAMPLSSIQFGAAEWQRFGDVGAEPPLPLDIEITLNGPCPIWPEKRSYETHVLVLIPATINGTPLTLDFLTELVQPALPPLSINEMPSDIKQIKDFIRRPLQPTRPLNWGNDQIRQHVGGTSVSASYWVLMTREVLPKTKSESYATQQEILARHSGYKVPKLLEVTICILMEYLKTGRVLYAPLRITSKKGIKFPVHPETFTRCQEPHLIVGNVTGKGIEIGCIDEHDHGWVGLGACKRMNPLQ